MSSQISTQSDTLSLSVNAESIEAVAQNDTSLLSILEALTGGYGIDDSLDDVAAAIQRALGLDAVIIAQVGDRLVRHVGMSPGVEIGTGHLATNESLFWHIQSDAPVVVDASSSHERRMFGLDEHEGLWALLHPVLESDRGNTAIASFGDHESLSASDLRQKLDIVSMVLAGRLRAASQVASERRHLDRLIKLQNLTARIIRHDGLTDEGKDIMDDIAHVFDYDAVRLGLCHGPEISFYRTYRDAVQRRNPMTTAPLGEDISGEIVRTGVPQFFTDPPLNEDDAVFPFRVRQLICVPLRINGEISGVLCAASGGSRSLVVDDLSMLMMLAESIGLVLANFRRLYEVERRNHQLRLVDSLVTLIAERTMIQQAIPEVAREIASRFDFQLVGIGLIENERIKYTFASIRVPMPPIKGAVHSFRIDDGITGRVARTGRAELVQDVREDPEFIDVGWNTRSEICVPIRASDEVIGVINVESGAERPLDGADLEVMQVIARHLGIAFENQALLESERSTRRAVEALHQVSTIVTSTLNVDEALRRIVDTLGSSFDYRYVIAGLTEGQFVQPKAAHGVALERLVRIPISSSAIGRVALTAQPLHVPDISAQTDLGLEALPDSDSLIVVPIARDNNMLGILIVIGSKSRPLVHNDMTMLQMFAQHAGVVLDNARMYEEARRMAYLDPMTQLPNHRHFQERFTADFARAIREERPLAVMVMDLDGFKQINDCFGHLEGDAVLIAASQRLAKRLRERDLLARYAGDEFVVLLPDTDARAAMMIGRRLCAAIGEKPFQISTGESRQLTISIGVAIGPEHGSSTKELLSAADKATYAAKHAGRNQVHLANS